MLEEKGMVYKTGKFTSDDITKVLSIISEKIQSIS